jgi:hypothetical protein
MMSRDKRAGVIRSDLYNNSIYSDKSDVSRSSSLNSGNINDNEKCSESGYSGIDCFNDYSHNHSKDNHYHDNSSDKGDANKTRLLLVCNLCKLDSHKDYIFLSCCNTVFHIKCLINKYTRDIASVVGGKNGNGGNTNEHYECFNENTITQGCFDKIICTNCDNKVNYEDIFALYSKNILCNKKFHTQHITQLNTLKDQKTKIENEIRCLNEYITKLDNEKNISKIIMDKTYKLLTD